jgi:hypothetical protein
MVALESLRWLLTAVFGAATAFHLVRCLRPGAAFPAPPVGHRFAEVLHLTMGASMIVMIWPWGERVPPAAWVAVFMAATGWFAAAAAGSASHSAEGSASHSPGGSASDNPSEQEPGAGHLEGGSPSGATRRFAPAFFATATGAMAWMGAAMPAQAAGVMPGMTMHPSTASAAWLSGALSGALGGYLVLAAIWWTLRGLRLHRLSTAPAAPQPVSWGSLCHGLMSAGMGLALLTLV